MKRRTRNHAKRQLTWLRRLPDVHAIDLTDGDAEAAAATVERLARDRVARREVREVAGARQRLRDRRGDRASRSSSPRSASARCARRTPGSGPTACCCCRDRGARASWRPAHLQPGRLGGRAVGNGVREAVLYLRRNGWTDERQLLGRDRRRRDPAAITGPDTCTRGHGTRAARVGARLPERAPRTAPARSRWTAASSRSSTCQVGNPQCAIEMADGLEELDLPAVGAADRAPRAVPATARTCRSGAATGERRDHARGSSSAGWGRRMSSGTGRHGRRRGGRARAAWTAR